MNDHVISSNQQQYDTTSSCHMEPTSYMQTHMNEEQFGTPKKNAAIPLACLSFTPECEENLKPKVGMTFQGLEAVEKFYKAYAHNAGFGVRIGQQKKIENKVVRTKRFMCNREGFKSKDSKEIDNPSKKKHRIVELVRGQRIQYLHVTRQALAPLRAYRLLQVSEGGISNVGCMKRDLQNYYNDLRDKIRNADAQMFVAQLARKQEVNSAFFYDFDVNDEGKLKYVFWADATSRKNYSLFGDVVSFDSTYTTNQYNMIFAPFTGVNHHLQSIFFGAAFLANEKNESYIWLFQTFLKAMGGVAPRLIITDEAGGMKIAIDEVLPTTVHRLCMWHIMEKVPEKVGPLIREDPEFWKRLNSCVWGSETTTEFESQWNSIITDFGLEENEWFAKRFSIRETWIPSYFMDISLAGILRTTSRESVFDEQGNLLEEKPTDALDATTREKISTIRNKMEDMIQKAKHSDVGMDFLTSSVLKIEAPLDQMVPTATKITRQEEYEAFIDCNIPTEVHIHPPTDVHTVGRCKRIKSGKETKEDSRKKKGKEVKARAARLCKTCKQIVFHDSRNCPSKGKRSIIVEDMQLNGAS
nr:protein FAR1-RELATED SEQUENCE 5-like [Aegilops tauschii subsp. strangulata]